MTTPGPETLRLLLVHPDPDVRRQGLHLALATREGREVLVSALDEGAEWNTVKTWLETTAPTNVQAWWQERRTDSFGDMVGKIVRRWVNLTAGCSSGLEEMSAEGCGAVAYAGLLATAERWPRHLFPDPQMLLIPVRDALREWAGDRRVTVTVEGLGDG